MRLLSLPLGCAVLTGCAALFGEMGPSDEERLDTMGVEYEAAEAAAASPAMNLDEARADYRAAHDCAIHASVMMATTRGDREPIWPRDAATIPTRRGLLSLEQTWRRCSALERSLELLTVNACGYRQMGLSTIAMPHEGFDAPKLMMVGTSEVRDCAEMPAAHQISKAFGAFSPLMTSACEGGFVEWTQDRWFEERLPGGATRRTSGGRCWKKGPLTARVE